MSVASKAQIGAVTETTYGTPVTVTKFFNFKSESLDFSQERMESESLRAGYTIKSEDWALGRKSVEGDIEMELRPKGHGFWWAHAIGTPTTTQPDAVGAPTVYKHTFVPAALPTSFTLQVGVPDITDTARPFTYQGCRISEWSLECESDGFANMTMTLLGQDVTTATALAVASYPTGNKPLTFVQGVASIGGSAAQIKSISIEGSNNLSDDRYFLGSALRATPLENDKREYSGEMEMEFNTLGEYTRFRDATEVEVILTFTGANIASTFNYETKITMNVRYDGSTPQVGGPDIVPHSIPFKVVDNGTTSIKVEYQTTDATVH